LPPVRAVDLKHMHIYFANIYVISKEREEYETTSASGGNFSFPSFF
jgi:hypothetical protein